MKVNDHGDFVLRSGRTIDANRGILGINVYPGDDDPSLYGGYDEEFGNGEELDGEVFGSPPFTTGERREIAEYMIDQWKRWGGLPR